MENNWRIIGYKLPMSMAGIYSITAVLIYCQFIVAANFKERKSVMARLHAHHTGICHGEREKNNS